MYICINITTLKQFIDLKKKKNFVVIVVVITLFLAKYRFFTFPCTYVCMYVCFSHIVDKYLHVHIFVYYLYIHM